MAPDNTVRFHERAEVLYNRKTPSGAMRLGVRMEVEGIVAGHFFMLRAAPGLDPLLNRPLGAYRLLDSHGQAMDREGLEAGRGPDGSFSGHGVEFLYNVVGRGTALLAGRSEGEAISVLGPLGRGFCAPDGDEASRVVMVGGGMGIVPFYLLGAALEGIGGVFLYGARARAEAGLSADFKGLGCGVKVSTEDGSAGRKGLVTDLLVDEIKANSIVCACGPPGMLRAVAATAREAGARCYVSLEKTMACGIGVCLGCAVKTGAGHGGRGNGYRMVCSDGPVFDAAEIDWESL